MPHLLEKKKTWVYFISVTVLIILLVLILMEFERYVIERAFPRPFGMVGPERPPFENDLTIFNRMRMDMVYKRTIHEAFFIVITFFISTIYRTNTAGFKQEQKMLELHNQILKAESNLLKWQINPHFLFNTLNNIYSLSQFKSEKTPDAIQRLSDMLRYVIYECNEPYVKLEKELNYIKGYFELQLLKDEEIKKVNYVFNIDNPNLKIAPLLLITFVENSFKHSNYQDTLKGWIRVEAQTEGAVLHYIVENSIPEVKMITENTKGIGLENVKRRLNLIYPDRHFLIVEETSSSYKIVLKLILDDN
ncbi:MAG: histidine kinase [Bacteroidetes bacterium]|nr:histidine kinase [Bacteroidota bacterium]